MRAWRLADNEREDVVHRTPNSRSKSLRTRGFDPRRLLFSRDGIPQDNTGSPNFSPRGILTRADSYPAIWPQSRQITRRRRSAIKTTQQTITIKEQAKDRARPPTASFSSAPACAAFRLWPRCSERNYVSTAQRMTVCGLHGSTMEGERCHEVP